MQRNYSRDGLTFADTKRGEKFLMKISTTMKAWIIFMCAVGILSFSLSKGISAYEAYQDRDRDKEFVLKNEVSGSTVKLHQHYPDKYKGQLCGGWGKNGWHVFYEHEESFCYIRIDEDKIFVLRRNPYNRFVVRVSTDGKDIEEIFKKSPYPTAAILLIDEPREETTHDSELEVQNAKTLQGRSKTL